MKQTNIRIPDEVMDGATNGRPRRYRKRKFMPTTAPVTKALGIHLSRKAIAEYLEIEAEAHKLAMTPSDYARRLLRLGSEVAKSDPVKLLTAVYEE